MANPRPNPKQPRGPAGQYTTFDPVERFWEKVQKTEGCWLWVGARHPKGYGNFRVNGIYTRAHRFSWELYHGHKVPSGMLVCHECDNPSCVNPKHLFLGTHRVNGQDMSDKRRGRKPPLICRRGHEFTESNTIRYPNGSRACRICRAAQPSQQSRKREHGIAQ